MDFIPILVYSILFLMECSQETTFLTEMSLCLSVGLLALMCQATRMALYWQWLKCITTFTLRQPLKPVYSTCSPQIHHLSLAVETEPAERRHTQSVEHHRQHPTTLLNMICQLFGRDPVLSFPCTVINDTSIEKQGDHGSLQWEKHKEANKI